MDQVRKNGRAQMVVLAVGALLAGTLMIPLAAAPASAGSSTPATVAAANGFSCGVFSGSVQCWGSGALGDGTNRRASRGPVTGLESGVVSVVGDLLSACALTTAGGVKCWGDNRSGGLGDGTTTDRDTPVDVVGLSSGVAQISAGGYQSCAVTTAGAVKCWGNGHLTPTDVPSLGSGIASVALSYTSACAVSTAGAAYCWGGNIAGQLGDGTMTDRPTPIAIPGLSSGVRSISLGSSHGCAAMTDGSVKCWGASSSGAIGPNATAYPSPPVAVPISGAVGIAAGSDSSCALLGTSHVSCWGRSMMLGNGSTSNSAYPVTVSDLSDASSVSIGTNHACASTPTGASCWGTNSEGAVGDGTFDPHPTPVPVVYLPTVITPRFAEVPETDAPGTTTLLARVELSVASAVPVSVDWATTTVLNSTTWDATPGVDYVAASGTLTFAPGERIAYAPVTVLGDDIDELDETIHLTLSNPVGAPLSDDQFGAQGIIRDDDPRPTVVPGVGTIDESDAGTTVLRVPVTLTGPSAFEISVPWTTLHVVGAPAGQTDVDDYVVASGSVTFAPGQTTAWAELTIVDDSQVEPDEYVVVSFNHPTNAAMGGFWGLGFGIIQNDD